MVLATHFLGCVGRELDIGARHSELVRLEWAQIDPAAAAVGTDVVLSPVNCEAPRKRERDPARLLARQERVELVDVGDHGVQQRVGVSAAYPPMP